jgi:hypothetical protein
VVENVGEEYSTLKFFNVVFSVYLAKYYNHKDSVPKSDSAQNQVRMNLTNQILENFAAEV